MARSLLHRWRVFVWALCVALAAPHGAANTHHHAVEMVICGGAKSVMLWVEREEAHGGHSVDCCLIHLATPPVEAMSPAVPPRGILRRVARATFAASLRAPSPTARGPPVAP